MRRLPREYGGHCDEDVCPRCGKIHSQGPARCDSECREERQIEIEKEVREIRKELHREEERERQREKCRCPYCGHDFIWPPEPCPRCGRVHDARKPWVSPGAASFDEDSGGNPLEGGFSRLFGGNNSMMSMLMMLMLFGGGVGGISEIRSLFMHPMFQMLEKMGDLSKGGNIMDALGPILGGDMGGLGSILAGLGKDGLKEE